MQPAGDQLDQLPVDAIDLVSEQRDAKRFHQLGERIECELVAVAGLGRLRIRVHSDDEPIRAHAAASHRQRAQDVETTRCSGRWINDHG